MSKLYDKFLELKNIDDAKIYLLKSGIFYISLNEDAKKLSEIFGFKITNLNDTVIKCGFPTKKLDFYSSLLEKMNIDFEIVDLSYGKIESRSGYVSIINFQNVVDKLVSIDFNNITFKESFDILYKLSEDTKKILETNEKN